MNYNYSITVIGFGEVGCTSANFLNLKLTSVLFNVIDPDTKLSGKILDFSHACAVEKNDVITNDFELLLEADFIIYAAGFNNKKGETRDSLALENKNLVFELFQDISLKPSAIVIAVTNPVDLISRWIFDALNHANLVIGTGNSLDAYRLDYIISQFENCSLEEVNTLVLGEHGEFMTAIPSKSYVRGKRIDEVYKEYELANFYEAMKNSASLIRETENATKYGVSACVLQIIDAFIHEKEIQLPISVRINSFYKNLFEVTEAIFISLPCLISNTEIHIKEYTDFTKKEISNLKHVAKHIENQFIKLS